jgi:hypothetical protein
MGSHQLDVPRILNPFLETSPVMESADAIDGGRLPREIS